MTYKIKQHDLQNSWFSAAAEISQLALFNNQKTKMSKVHQKKKISQKSKELHFINQMTISKEVKQELLRSTKNKKNGLNRVMNRKKFLKKK